MAKPQISVSKQGYSLRPSQGANRGAGNPRGVRRVGSPVAASVRGASTGHTLRGSSPTGRDIISIQETFLSRNLYQCVSATKQKIRNEFSQIRSEMAENQK